MSAGTACGEAVTLAILLDAIAYRRLSAARAGISTKGLLLSVACGVFMSMFYRFVAGWTTDNARKLWKVAVVR